MKALQVDGPGQARVVEVPEPQPGTGDALLQVRRVGLCGTDLNTFRGRNPMVSFPRILGHEVAATVLELPAARNNQAIHAGTDVTLSPYKACGTCTSCRIGRVNACRFNQTLGVQRDGAMTRLLRYDSRKLYPAALNRTELCLVEPLTVGFHAVERGMVRAGETVAIIGCGGVGLGAISGASVRGARVIAIDQDDSKLALARQAGASDLIHSGRESLGDALDDLTGGEMPACIIEAVGLPETFRAAVELVSFSGRVVYIGYAKEPVPYDTKLFVQKELNVLGSRNALPENFHEVIRMLEAKRFPVQEAVTTIVSLDESPAILKQWSEDPARFTKIMVEIS